MIFPTSENSLYRIDIDRLNDYHGSSQNYSVRIRAKSDNKVVVSMYVQTLRQAAKLGRIVAHELDAMAEEIESQAKSEEAIQFTLDL